MKHTHTLLIAILCLVLTGTSCSQNQSGEVSLDVKIGQMLKVGFRGLSVDEQSPVVQDIEEYHIGGVVLFDYDVPKDTTHRNIASPSTGADSGSSAVYYPDSIDYCY